MTTISSLAGGSSAYYANQKSLFSKLDADESGTLSSDEFVAGRPKGVSESQASALYAKIDTGGSGALTEDQLLQGMDSDRPSHSPQDLLSDEAMSVLMLLSSQGGAFGGASAADLYAEMDADDDGSVTAAEFIAARPEDVSEDDARALYATIDTEGSGSITEEQFAEAMPGPGGPPPAGAALAGGNGTAQEVFDSLDANQDGVVSSDEFLAAFPGGFDVAGLRESSTGIDEILSLLNMTGEDTAA